MKIELTKFLDSISLAFDYVENEYLQALLADAARSTGELPLGEAETALLMKVAPFHAKRVAVLTNRLASFLDIDPETVYALTHAALLHDCALSEYLDIFTREDCDTIEAALKPHCIAGEKIATGLPFYDQIQSTILYHHEQANGSGPFGKRSDEVPLGAQLIHIADELDVRFSLEHMDEEKFQTIRSFVAQQKGISYSAQSADAFLHAVDYELLFSITGEGSQKVLDQLIPNKDVELSVGLLRKMALIFADITDYKSKFTWRHSLGIAQKAEAIGHFYGYTDEVCDKLYIAGALHDVGKLFISNDILEKPGKLTGDEYREIQNHAAGTWKLLGGIGGMEQITSWAANHHEKLDGSGYPYGKEAGELGQNERLMACLDIYQALVEERPYKAGLSHAQAMEILDKMGSAGQLDTAILADIDACFAGTEEVRLESTPAEAEVEYTGETWRCPVCGYIYEGALPDDFICPRCEQPRSVFERIN